MNTTQLKDKLLSMKDKADKYEKIKSDYIILENKYNASIKNEDLNTISSKYFLLKSEYLETQVAFNKTKQQLFNLQHKYSNSSFNSEDFKDRISCLIGEIDDMKGIIGDKNKIIQKLEDKVSLLTGEIDDMKNASYEKSKTIKNLKFDVNNLESTVEKHEKLNSQLVETNKIQKIDVDELAEYIIELKDKLNELNGFSVLYNNSKDILDKYEKLKIDYENTEDDNNSLLFANNSLRSDIEKLTMYNSNFITQIEKDQLEIALIKDENQKLTEITKTFIDELGVSEWDLVNDIDPPSN
jgi:chromosome segregation ATPase